MSYELISPTAYTIAFLRGLAGIPLAARIASLSDATEATKRFYRRSDFEIDLARMAKMADWIKLRFCSLETAVQKTGLKNIFELASGLSPAGLIWTLDPAVQYLETDLPKMIVEKEQIITALGRSSANLNLAALDALDGERMKELADQFFGPKPIVITHEGLFPYLTHEEKLVVAKNIAAVLKSRGGVWITTDISLKQNFERAFKTSDYSKKLQSVLNEATSRDMVELAFTSFDEAEELFRSAGFSVERHTQLEVVPDLLLVDDLAQAKNLPYQQVWTTCLA